MHRLFQVVVLGFAVFVAGPVRAFSEIPPEDYLFFSVKSFRIVLIEVDSVKVDLAGNKNGIEVHNVTVAGKRIETIRGNDTGLQFSNQSPELRVSKYEEARRSFSEGQVEMLLIKKPHLGSQCKKGHRYLVIFEGNDPIYFEVSKDDDGWRKKMLENEKRWNEQK
ncbi:hypothetical protein [Luteolibacter soli]|uniref:TNase-like domain-containing protein n=1 Tax=Luteolibacter soli TaxID=3135280 RepID=A0ABU9AXF5_9BACT